MNIYEQLEGMKDELERRGVRTATLAVMDKMIQRAAGQRDSALSVSRLQVLRHVMGTPEVLNNEDVRLDLLGLEGDLEDAAALRPQQVEVEMQNNGPKLKKFYKNKKKT